MQDNAKVSKKLGLYITRTLILTVSLLLIMPNMILTDEKPILGFLCWKKILGWIIIFLVVEIYIWLRNVQAGIKDKRDIIQTDALWPVIPTPKTIVKVYSVKQWNELRDAENLILKPTCFGCGVEVNIKQVYKSEFMCVECAREEMGHVKKEQVKKEISFKDCFNIFKLK